MSYKYSKGSQVIGDLKAADDTERNTMIDFGEDQIDLQTGGLTRAQINNTGVDITGDLTTTGDITCDGVLNITANDGGDSTAISITAGNNDIVAMRFGNATTNFGYNLIYSGSGTGNDNDFILSTDGQNGPPIEVLRIKQDGISRFQNQVIVSSSLETTLYVSGAATVDSDLRVNSNIYDYQNKSFIKNINYGGFLNSNANTTAVYLPEDSLTEPISAQYYTTFVAPFSGSVDKIVLRSSYTGGSLADLGDLTITVRIGYEGTDAYNLDTSPDTIESVTVLSGNLAHHTNATFEFSASNFTPQDIYAISITPTNNWNNNGNKYISYTIVSSYILD